MTGQEGFEFTSCLSDGVFWAAPGTFWHVALENSGNRGVELVRKRLRCLPSVRSTLELSSCGFPGFLLGGSGGLPFCFFQTLQSLLPDKRSLVLQQKFWDTYV